MEFTSFDVDCGGDYVIMYSSSYQFQDFQLAKFCGTNIPPIFKIHDEILIKFVTDDVTERSGFQFAWRPMSKLVLLLFAYIKWGNKVVCSFPI